MTSHQFKSKEQTASKRGSKMLVVSPLCVNSLWPSDAIWRHWSWSALAQAMPSSRYLLDGTKPLPEPMLIIVTFSAELFHGEHSSYSLTKWVWNLIMLSTLLPHLLGPVRQYSQHISGSFHIVGNRYSKHRTLRGPRHINAILFMAGELRYMMRNQHRISKKTIHVPQHEIPFTNMNYL